MKLLSFVIPCYNSQDYMKNAVNSILPAGDDVEIIIVNDGSTDNTSDIAHKLEKKYKNIVRVIDKPNGGHGDAVITGLQVAIGKYFKVVDSDDWVNKNSLNKIMDCIRRLEDNNQEVDMFLSNYVYEKEGARRKKTIHYRNVFENETITDWDSVAKFKLGQYILMHSVIYRTEMLRESNITLPRHTFYVDNIYVYYPLPFVKSIYYIDTDFYRYYIGREDQSVNEKVMMSRVDQQILVTKLMIDMYKMKDISNVHLRKYMINYLSIMMTISSILLIKIGDKEALDKKKSLWKYLKSKDMSTYFKIRHSILGGSMNLPTKAGRGLSKAGYRIARKIVGFN